MREDKQAVSESRARRQWHWCLAAVLLPVISLPFEWLEVYRHYRLRGAMPDQRRWAYRILVLAVTDTIAAVLIIALLASGLWGWHTITNRPSRSRPGEEALRIGVTVVASPERPEEVQIGTVATDSPAARAGLQPGDVLVSLDATRIRKVEDMSSMIQSGRPGTQRTLRIRRAGQEAALPITPERRPAIRQPAGPLFDATPTQSCLAEAMEFPRTLFRWTGFWAAALLMIALWLLERRAQPGAPPLWLWVVAALGSGVLLASPLAWSAVCLGIGGRSVGGVLVAGLADHAAALIIGLIAMRSMAGKDLLGARLGPALGARRAVVLGFFYVGAIQVRLTILGAAVEAFGLVHLPTPETDALGGLPALGWSGQLLLALWVAVVAPVAVEVLFRGVILPRLASWMGTAWAIVASSALFSVLHESSGAAQFGVRAASIFALAVVLAWTRLRTGGLAAPITMHMVVNAFSLWVHQ